MYHKGYTCRGVGGGGICPRNLLIVTKGGIYAINYNLVT